MYDQCMSTCIFFGTGGSKANEMLVSILCVWDRATEV